MENNGYFIKKLRLSKNLTQSQLAEGMALTPVNEN